MSIGSISLVKQNNEDDDIYQDLDLETDLGLQYFSDSIPYVMDSCFLILTSLP